MFRIFLKSVCLFFLFSPHLYAAGPELIYNDFYKKISLKYDTEKKLQILYRVAQKLDTYEEKANPEKKAIFQEISAYNAEKIYEIWHESELSKNNQIFIEKKSLLSFSEGSYPSYIGELEKQGKKIYSENASGEILKENNIFLLRYTQYISLNEKNYKNLINLSGIILKSEKGDYRFIENYSWDEKIPYSRLQDEFKVFLTPEKKFQVHSDGIYYGYYFDAWSYFSDTYGVYESQLQAGGYTRENTLLYRDKNGRYNFVNKYFKRQIGESSIFFGIANKSQILQSLTEDAELGDIDIPKTWNMLKTQVSGFSGSLYNTKISDAYSWILGNISYTENPNLTDKKVSSGLHTYLKKNGVCTGYAKLFLYMISLAGIDKATLIRGHVIDAEDFPEIGHAWIRVGENYYDPTFDDPVGSSMTRMKQEYLYFGLPQDIFYANRFEYGELPMSFKTASDIQIQQHIFNILSNLLSKYQNDINEYKILLPIQFRKEYDIPLTPTLTPDILAQKIGYFTVSGNNFRYQENGNIKSISSIKYYVLSNVTLESSLAQIDYKVSEHPLFYWEVSPGIWEWRLAYELTTR